MPLRMGASIPLRMTAAAREAKFSKAAGSWECADCHDNHGENRSAGGNAEQEMAEESNAGGSVHLVIHNSDVLPYDTSLTRG